MFDRIADVWKEAFKKMITLNDAIKKIEAEGFNIVSINETPNRWIFFDDSSGVGDMPMCVYKDSGETDIFSIPLEFEEYKCSKEVKL